jgi:hypothetical protein
VVIDSAANDLAYLVVLIVRNDVIARDQARSGEFREFGEFYTQRELQKID